MAGDAPFQYAKNIAFRRADPVRDAQTLIEFGCGLYIESLGSDRGFRREYGQRGQRFPFWIAACAAADPAFAAFLTEDEKIIGMAVLGADGRDRSIGLVHHFYMRPTHRGRGFGGLLDDYARDVLRRAGYERARLNVTARNRRALRFYIAQGWTDMGGAHGLRFMEVAL